MTHHEQCTCDTCKERTELEQMNPDKVIGLQYAYWDFEKFQLLVSAEELPYIQEDAKDKPLVQLNNESNNYFIVYGVFKSQTNFNENFFDLYLSKQGTYFYFDSDKEQSFEVKVIDFTVLSKQKDEAKVCLLLKVNDDLSFPKSQGELSITLSRTMTELGDTMRNLVFSRIEQGIFRLDCGKKIDEKKIGRWKKQISSKKCFDISYKRFLIIEKE